MIYLKTYEDNLLYNKFSSLIGKYVIIKVEDYYDEYEEYNSKYKLVKIDDITPVKNEYQYYLQYTYIHFTYKHKKVQSNHFYGSNPLIFINLISSFDNLNDAKKEWRILQEIDKYNL